MMNLCWILNSVSNAGFRDNQLDELRDAVSIGLEGRRARLRDLLLQDASLYEGELGLKGLAIYKEVV